jgi:hypothetical protein
MAQFGDILVDFRGQKFVFENFNAHIRNQRDFLPQKRLFKKKVRKIEKSSFLTVLRVKIVEK